MKKKWFAFQVHMLIKQHRRRFRQIVDCTHFAYHELSLCFCEHRCIRSKAKSTFPFFTFSDWFKLVQFFFCCQLPQLNATVSHSKQSSLILAPPHPTPDAPPRCITSTLPAFLTGIKPAHADIQTDFLFFS